MHKIQFFKKKFLKLKKKKIIKYENLIKKYIFITNMEKQIEDKIKEIRALISEYERLFEINKKKLNGCCDNENLFVIKKRITDKNFNKYFIDETSSDETSSDEEVFVRR